jgi:hypothetical protein
MGISDKSHKMLLGYDDEFAEVFSVLALNNEVRIDPKRLLEASTEYEHVEYNKPEELRRDVVKLYDGFALGLIVCGFENQMSVDIAMPVRVMGYDWTRYRYQLEKVRPLNRSTRIAPVFSHVLNFSYRHKWQWPDSLRDLVNLPPELAKFFRDYKISVTNLAWLSLKQRNRLTGDFRILVEALCEMRTKGRITGIKQPVKYIDAMLACLSAATQTQSFNLMDKTDFQEGKTTMCEIMERWENELKLQGERIGFANGERAGFANGEKAGFANGEKAGFANGEKAGFANGEKAGFANGEKASAVRTCRDFGKSQSETAVYLTQRLHMSMEEAREAMKKYW